MLKKLILLFSVIVLAFAVVACGDDEEEPASGGTETTQTEDSGATETTEDPGATEAEDSGSTEEGGADPSDPAVQQAVESCKQAVQAQSATLSEDLISEFEGICEEAATDPEAAREASIQVCKRIAEEMVPEGSARDQVIAQCEAAGAP